MSTSILQKSYQQSDDDYNSDLDPNLVQARMIMNLGLFSCMEEPFECIKTCFCHSCIVGYNFSRSEQGPCLIGCCCFPFLCGISRGGIQRFIGIKSSSFTNNCLSHVFCPLCSTVQETRALNAYFKGLARIRATQRAGMTIMQ